MVRDSPPEPGMKGVLMFQHTPMHDSLCNCPVKPMIAVLYEHHSDSVDAVEYSVGNLGTKPYKLNWKLLGGFPEHCGDQHSVVFDATYIRESIEHNVVLAYIKCNNFGVEIICDGTTGVFENVEFDMRSFIRNFNIAE